MFFSDKQYIFKQRSSVITKDKLIQLMKTNFRGLISFWLSCNNSLRSIEFYLLIHVHQSFIIPTLLYDLGRLVCHGLFTITFVCSLMFVILSLSHMRRFKFQSHNKLLPCYHCQTMLPLALISLSTNCYKRIRPDNHSKWLEVYHGVVKFQIYVCFGVI